MRIDVASDKPNRGYSRQGSYEERFALHFAHFFAIHFVTCITWLSFGFWARGRRSFDDDRRSHYNDRGGFGSSYERGPPHRGGYGDRPEYERPGYFDRGPPTDRSLPERGYEDRGRGGHEPMGERRPRDRGAPSKQLDCFCHSVCKRSVCLRLTHCSSYLAYASAIFESWGLNVIRMCASRKHLAFDLRLNFYL